MEKSSIFAKVVLMFHLKKTLYVAFCCLFLILYGNLYATEPTQNANLESPSSLIVFKQPTQKITKKKKPAQVSQYELETKDILDLAATGLYSDPVAAIKTLPGIVSIGTFDARMFIRGGDYTEVLYVVDQRAVFNPYFFGGLISILNTKLVENIQFYAGGFPAKYGNVISSVIDVDYKEGHLSQNRSELDINLTELNFLTEGPIVKNKSSYLSFLSLRQKS